MQNKEAIYLPSEAGPGEAAVCAGCRVLLFVEAAPLRGELSERLQKAGACVAAAGSEAEAQRLFAASPDGAFSLILTDLVMPQIAGFSLYQMVRESAHPQARTVPFLMLADPSLRSEIERCCQTEGCEYLEWPAEGGRLEPTVCRLCCLPLSAAQG